MSKRWRSTILVALFSGNAETNGLLSALVTSIQEGLNSFVGNDPPDVHCLYRLGENNDAAYQYQLKPNGNPIPQSGHTPAHTGNMKDQLVKFFFSEEVTESLQNGGPVFLIIGAHGTPNGGSLSIVFGRLIHLLRSLFRFRSSLRDYQQKLRVAWSQLLDRSLPAGSAFHAGTASTTDSITLSELSATLDHLAVIPQTLILHSCYLSSIEVIHELQKITHHIACESQLGGGMDVSKWFAEMALGSTPEQLTGSVIQGLEGQRSDAGHPVQMIASSHWTDSKNETAALLPCLNDLGKELKAMLIAGMPSRLDIEHARYKSRADSQESIDLWRFCDLYSPASESCRRSMARMQCAVDKSQIGRHLTMLYSWNKQTKQHHGISVFFPSSESAANIDNLPDQFRAHAPCWIAFLREWMV